MAKLNNELVKAESRGLAGNLAEEVANEEAYFTEAAKLLLKFHGVYEQQDRDARKINRGDHNYQCMIRTKLPGGQLTAEQYLIHDWIASEYGNDTLRITTRQDFQFHGVLKRDLRDTIRELNNALITTLGACGDIVRNVMACPAPTADPQRLAVQNFAHELSAALFPRTKAYHQIWVDGQALIEEEVEDPLYGKTYLPRKFKIAIAFPGDNCVDVYTNDVGLVAIFEHDALVGFNMLVGGGMGMTHGNDSTYARLADLVGFITSEQVIEAVTAVVTIHRDYGDRVDRKHARLKYILQAWGVERFREELQSRVSFPIQAAREMPPFEASDHLGWNEQGDGRLYLGIHVENGRIIDRGNERIRSGLRAVIEQFRPDVRLTAQQNILLVNIQPQDRAAIDTLLAAHGIRPIEQLSAVRRGGLACPALPTCGLAITEAERAMPKVLDQLEDTLNELGIPDEPLAVRMTGCPNGCARPYIAEIAFVGRSLNKYAVFLGGNPEGTRLAQPFLDIVHIDDLVAALRPVLAYFRDARLPTEPFGDFVQRVGLDALRALATSAEDVAPAGD